MKKSDKPQKTSKLKPDDLVGILSSPDDNEKIARFGQHFSQLVEKAVVDVNANFAMRQLSKLPRKSEPLPTNSRQLSSYRTRIGTMLEYALGTAINRILQDQYGDGLLLTFVSAHQYPDFYLRDNNRQILARIEMKAIDAESDEQAARFDVATDLIDSNKDLLLIVGWSWQDIKDEAGHSIAERPVIFASLAIPAGELARERDERLAITGGKIVDGQVMVYSKKTGKFVPDPGNYGKFWRIIHRSRITQQNPSPTVQAFMDFLQKVDALSPRTRIRIQKSARKK